MGGVHMVWDQEHTPVAATDGHGPTVSGQAPAFVPAAERPDLETIVRSARRLAHQLNNDLALPAGALELVARERALPPRLRDLVLDAAASVAAAVEHVAEFQRLLHAAQSDGRAASPPHQ